MSSIQTHGCNNSSSRNPPPPSHSEANENEFQTPLNSIPLPPLRTPLNTIPDPSQNPKDSQDNDSSDFKPNNRSTHKKIESLSHATPNNRRGGGGKVQLEPKSGHSTPARSASSLVSTRGGGGGCSRVLKGISIAPPEPAIEIPYFELVQDPSFWTDHNVQVLIRIRPISSMEKVLQGNVRCLKQENAQTLSWLGHPETRFTFDHIACEMISQEKLFKVAGLPMVENCMSGYNSCMFAYGQTGSGKTYTMMGDIYELDEKLHEDCGMTPRIFEYLFTRISAEEELRRDENLRYSCKCSFLEIYNEQITDLLEPSSTNLQLREDLGKGVYVENLTEYEVTTVKDVVQLLLKGAANRKMAATNMNSESSRSHSVFTCIIQSRRDIDSVTHLRFGRLNLVDLAGSERQKSSGAEGERLKEAANINKSLSTLGLVIMTLVDVAHGKQRHVPYRDSRLTFLLQDSLGGNSKTTIIANISPSICSANETLSTLKFAQRAKLIQNNAKVNEDAPGDVMALQQQIQQLKGQLTFLLKHQSLSKSPTICWPNFEQSQSGDLHEIYDSTLEGKISDHPKSKSFPKEKMISIQATLGGALRREKMADTSVKRLEAEIEHMNRLVHQREEDAQRTKMILRFREEKIKRLELLSDGIISADEYLVEENKALSEEVQLLQARIDRNPELTQFALENIRLIEHLRMFQDFYEQGEREALLAEVAELRDQLIETVQGNYGQLKSASATASQVWNKDTTCELEDCRRNLDACLDFNAKLTMEVDQLQRVVNTYTDCSKADTAADSASRDSETTQQTDQHSSVCNQVPHSQVKIMSPRNESEDEIEPYDQDDDAFQIMKHQKMKMDDALVLHPHDLLKDLMDAKTLIEAMEHEQVRLSVELEILQEKNFRYVELLEKKACEERKLLHKLGSNLDQQKERDDPCPEYAAIMLEGSGNIGRFTLAVKLDGLSRELEQAKILNKRYLNDQASRILHQNEFEQVCQQVEAETAKTIIHLQDELAKLQEELQENMISMTEENSRLRNIIEAKEDEINALSEEWEKATLELTSFLVDGSRSLADASEQIGSIASSFPERKAWISEHVERAANNFLEKERTILLLQKSLEDAQKLGLEMNLKLSSLKGATLAITEIQQLEKNENSREVILLQKLLSEKMAKIVELEEKLKNEDHIIEADKHGIDANERSFEIHNHSDINNIKGFSEDVQAISQLQCSKLRHEEAVTGCNNTREVLHPNFSDTIFVGEKKINMASSFFSKFEEAQATVKEADDMLNALLQANENAKHVTDLWKQAGEELMMERVGLIEEVQQLKSSICLKEGEYESMQDQLHSSLAEIELSISSLEESFLQMKRDVEESFKVVCSDIFSLGQDLLGFICKTRSSLEEIWAEIMENGFALFVMYLCYTGNLFEKVSCFNLDPDSFRYRQNSGYSAVTNVREGCTSVRGGSMSDDGTKSIEKYEIENLQHKLCNLGHNLPLNPFLDMVLKSEEERMDMNPVNLMSENLSLQRELARKDVLLKGLLFDISLLQESISTSKDIKDETEQMFAALTTVRHELAVKSAQLDEILLQHRKLEGQVVDCEAALYISNSKVEQANEAIEVLSKKNSDLTNVLENLYLKKATAEEKLEEQKEVIKSLEKEILRIVSSVEEKNLFAMEEIEDELRRVTAERDHLREEVASLNDRLETAFALADENEAIAVEARQESEANKVYAEQKEEEAKILEHSVEELESTINVLETKVYDMGAEVERHYKMRDDLELELQALRLRMLTVENSTENMDSEFSDFGQKEYRTSRHLIERTVDLEELKEHIRVLEQERADQAIEIKKCREYISELILHAEAQATQYQQKYKTLEGMVREVLTDTSASTSTAPTLEKIEKNSMRTRGSSSPFRCIAGLVQQMKLEKDQEMSAAMLKIEDLEALASSRQKEVCMLNARLAAAENMTHDVIRDLLGVKLDMTNYANLIDQHQVQQLLEEAHQQTKESAAKGHENLKLRKKITDLTEEIQSCIEEINQKEADILAAQVTLEQLKQRDQMLTAQNEMLKIDKINLKKKITEMDEILKKQHGPHQQPTKLKDNNSSRSSSEELRKRLVNSDKLLSRVNDELAWYSSDSSDPHNRQEQWLRNKRQEPENRG